MLIFLYRTPISDGEPQNYTQNIDTLENITGIRRVLQCHGSFMTASCLECRTRVPISEIEQEIFARRVPYCRVCNPPAGAPRKKAEAGTMKAKPRQKGKTGWGPDDEDVRRPGDPVVPGGIMKVRPHRDLCHRSQC
jgi:NAD-dependent SIR2 family protein deacetylase